MQDFCGDSPRSPHGYAENIANNSSLLKVTLNIEFEADSAKIKSESYDELRKFADIANILGDLRSDSEVTTGSDRRTGLFLNHMFSPPYFLAPVAAARLPTFLMRCWPL